MNHKLFIIPALLMLIFCNCCESLTGRNSSADPIHINRFDKALFQLIAQDTPDLQEKITAGYPEILHIIGLGVFDISDINNPVFFDKLINYYAEPALNKLYRDAIKQFDNINRIEADLGAGFQYLKSCFPTMQIPAVYIHVSGLQQNTLVSDSLLSVSIDKYLGFDYPLYQDFFFDYQLRKMIPERIVPDYLKAWLLSEYPFKGNSRVLLDRMIHEGKILYIIHKALPKVLPEVLSGYSSSEYQWCKKNEKVVWKTMIERNHLYTPDAATTESYFSDRPSDFFSNDAPGNLGSWIGRQIVTKYMDRMKVSIEDLMNDTDYQEILRVSRYKP